MLCLLAGSVFVFAFVSISLFCTCWEKEVVAVSGIVFVYIFVCNVLLFCKCWIHVQFSG